MEAIKQAEGSRISIQGQWINNLSFADDVDMLELEKDKDRLQSSLVDVEWAKLSMGLKTNVNRTQTTVFGQQDIEHRLYSSVRQ